MIMNFALILLGCGLMDGGSIDTTCEDLPGGCDGKGGTTTAQLDDIAIDSVNPEYGPTEGGESVVIGGGPFAADATVLFGGVEAELQTWMDNEVRVIVPPHSADGWVDVEINTSVGTGRAEEGYRYFHDATDLVGMVGMFEHIHQLGGLGDDIATGHLEFITPQRSASWIGTIADGWDQCRSDWNPDLGFDPIDPGADSLNLVSAAGDGSALSLAWNSAEQSYDGIDGTGSVSPDTLTAGSTWDVDDFSGTQLPAFALDSVLTIPDSFSLTTPALDGTSLTLKSTELSFAWPQSDNSDGMYLSLLLADSATGSELERVTCLVNDDGAFTVPASSFASWDAGKTLYIKMGRLIETVAILPLDSSETRLLGSYAVLGAATTTK